jgi:hypothetical protein
LAFQRTRGDSNSRLADSKSVALLDRQNQPLKPPPFGHGVDKIAKNGSVFVTQAENNNQGNQLKIRGTRVLSVVELTRIELATS